MDPGVIAIYGYPTFCKVAELNPNPKVLFSVLSSTLVRGGLPLCRDAEGLT